jgi:probable rRNA maturation factor
MIDVELIGASLAADAPTSQETLLLCSRAAAALGVHDGHVAVELVDAERIAQLNAEHRGLPKPTDVLSFPIDGVAPLAGVWGDGPAAADPRAPLAPLAPLAPPRELGDIVICPQHTVDLREAIVHGMLHLLGMDHETDSGEMLALQDELLEGARR